MHAITHHCFAAARLTSGGDKKKQIVDIVYLRKGVEGVSKAKVNMKSMKWDVCMARVT